MKRLLDQWERKNKRSNAVADPTGWEAEIEDDEVMEDAPPPAAEDNFFYGACHGEPALLDALRTKREVEDGVDL